jgi:hypothetical protein
MPDSAVHPAPGERPELVDGEIVAIEGDRIRVRLGSGVTGFAAPADGTTPVGVRVGSHATFRIESSDPNGAPRLAFAASPEGTETDESFDREVVRLHNALANHSPTNSARPAEHEDPGEEQIQQWIGHVDKSLTRLHKNRAKRLNEEFYNGS